MSFTDEEQAYLRSQRLARIATVADDGQPDVAPVGFEFDGTYLFVSGIDLTRTRKFRNVRDGNTKVAIVVDDLVSVDPWTPRFLRIYGNADVVERSGRLRSGTYLRITPTVSWSFNMAGQQFNRDGEHTVRRTVHQA